MIGIICAMREEMDGIEKTMDIKEEILISSIIFKIGIIGGKKCILSVSNAGKVNAAICAQTMILNYKVSHIINVGTAGSISIDLNVGDVVIARNVIQYDYDISAFGKRKKGEISGLGICEIPCNKDMIKKASCVVKEINGNVYIGNIVTGDKFVNDKDEMSYLKNEFKGLACEMECGSIGQVCYMNDTAFIAIKVISDGANKSSVVEFKDFIIKYPQNMSYLIKNLVMKI